MNSLVSIIIPAYNAEKYISETIQSVINQTYGNWELIIVDDGSTDNTAEIAKKFLTDKRINYFFQKNSGVSSARNSGIKNSHGEFIAFLDADDVWAKNNLEKKIQTLLENPMIDWIFSDVIYMDEYSVKKKIVSAGIDENILENILLWEREVIPAATSNIVVKKKCMEGILFDTSLSTAADQDFCIQLARKFKGKRIPESLFMYRVLPQSMSRNIKLMETDHIKVYRKAVQLKIFKSYWFKQKCFSNLYMIIAGSWWVNEENKIRGLYFILKSIIAYPPIIMRLLKKLLKKLL